MILFPFPLGRIGKLSNEKINILPIEEMATIN